MAELTTGQIAILCDELVKQLGDLNEADPIRDAGPSVLCILSSRPLAARNLAYKKLHAYPFKDVPLCWRRVYEEACLWEIVQSLKKEASTGGLSTDDHNAKWTTSIIHLCDNAIIFAGTPARRDLIDSILAWIDHGGLFDAQPKRTLEPAGTDVLSGAARASKRRRVDIAEDSAVCQSTVDRLALPVIFPDTRTQKPSPSLKQSRMIPKVDQPSLSSFSRHMTEQHGPLILQGTLEHWPALQRWQDPNYWLQLTHAGRRLVPVELGSSYTDESWGQKIMEFGEYLRKYVLEIHRDDRCHASGEAGDPTDQISTEPEKVRKGYLAQHDLLSQIPALRNDLTIPDYCYLDSPQTRPMRPSLAEGTPPPSPPRSISEDDVDVPVAEPQLNIWLGPHGTVSPAHTDPHENILAQVVGRKYVRLFAPDETARMYPMGVYQAEHDDTNNKHNGTEANDPESHAQEVDMQNTSRVDVGTFVDWFDAGEDDGHRRREASERFPDHVHAAYFEGIIEPGECLYIPRGWWHYIHSLSASCSVSFWWD